MGDLINGRTPEVIKAAIEKCVDGDCDGCAYDDVLGCSTAQAYDTLAYIERLEVALKYEQVARTVLLEDMLKWISVKERLPEKSGKYIVCTRKKAVYCTAFRFFHGKGYFATDTNTHITHWMPLPEPPEEED